MVAQTAHRERRNRHNELCLNRLLDHDGRYCGSLVLGGLALELSTSYSERSRYGNHRLSRGVEENRVGEADRAVGNLSRRAEEKLELVGYTLGEVVTCHGNRERDGSAALESYDVRENAC